MEKLSLFPTLGISLTYFPIFIRNCNGRDKLENLSTEDVCQLFVKQWTSSYKCSLCEFVQMTSPLLVKEANVFISHAWKYKFLDVVDSLFHHFEGELNDNYEIIVWFDIFSVNQHISSIINPSWWFDCFSSAIDKMHRTVLILAPWKDPIPLTRAWCLFEIYSTAKSKGRFEIAMSEGERSSFIAALMDGEQYETLNTFLATVNVLRSEATEPGDKEKIFQCVEESVGFDTLNSMVLGELRKWMIQTADELLLPPSSNNNMKLQIAIASIYQYLGNLTKAEGIYVSLLKKLKENQHSEEGNELLLKVMYDLASLYSDEGKLNEAHEFHVNSLSLAEKIYGTDESYPDYSKVLEYKNNVGSSYYWKGDYDEAEKIFEEILPLQIKYFTENHITTLRSMNTLALIYTQLLKYQLAEELSNKALTISEHVLGKEHYETLRIINNVALLYFNQKKFFEAKELYEKCLNSCNIKFGEESPNTLAVMHNLAMSLEELGDLSRAREIYLDCMNKRRKVLGEEHIETIRAETCYLLLLIKEEINEENRLKCFACYEHCVKALGETHSITVTFFNGTMKLFE